MDDIRNHDASPTREEAEWLATDAVALIVRALALAGLALVIGVSANMVLEVAIPASTVATAAP